MMGAVSTLAAGAGVTMPGSGILASMNPFDLRTIDVGYMFTVLVNAIPVGEFHAVEGISRSIPTEEYYEGGRNEQPLNFIKPGKYSDITLKWGLVQRGWMYNWMTDVKEGKRFRRDLVILMQDRMLIPTRVFGIIGAFPVEWSSPTMDGQGSNVPIETLKLRFHTMTMVARHVI
jgi:phage tail-like protein